MFERIERIVPFTFVFVCALTISFRLMGVIPPIVSPDEFDVSRTIFADAGIGGLLAVFAIVISLTLMGIQFASQEYTHRVMNTYLTSPMLWTMMGSYLITVLYNLYMVALLRHPFNPVFADVSVILQSLCLVLLVPHFVIAVFHLKPDSTISRLLNSLDHNYLKSIKSFLGGEKSHVPHKVDRLLPVVEMVEKCIERGDRATVRAGLEEMLVCYRRFVTSENEVWLSRYFLDYFLRLGREAVIEADDDSIAQVLEVLGEIGRSSYTTTVASLTVNHIHTIGSNALRKEYDVAVEQMIDSLQRIVIASPTADTVEHIFDSYGEIARQLFSLDKKTLVLYFAKRLSEITSVLVEKQDIHGLKKWTAVLEDVGRLAVARDMRDVVHTSIQAMCQAGTCAAQKQLAVCDSLVDSLVRIEREISKTDRELFSEINFAKQEIEKCQKKYCVEVQKDAGIETSDLW